MIDVDLLVSECIKANRGEKAFAYLVSPFISDFRIPASLVKFASNLINVTDVEHMSDLIALLAHYGGQIYVITRSPQDLMGTTISPHFVGKQLKILLKLKELKCDIHSCPKLHAKATVTSQGAVSGSFNLTESGRFFNLEEGHFFPNVEESQKQYSDILAWVQDLFSNQSIQITDNDLLLNP
ncbi:MAG: phospholipase D-like domain-containing protein [Candidatus Bathyarchaeota archaeon]|nr:phospholipase D-like domain-containing protein [Candidatus Bathyarchaeota archaeon]